MIPPELEWNPASLRRVPEDLVKRFIVAEETPSDINEHLGLLWRLSADCEHVTEFKLRGGISTLALLTGQPETLISWDIDPVAGMAQRCADLLAMAGRTTFQPRIGDTLKIVIEPTDLLFIDTRHTARHLLSELERHADPLEDKVKKYLVFHDTTTFGTTGEDGSIPGLRAAIRKFQKEVAFPLWELIEDRDNNNGLVVLRHV